MLEESGWFCRASIKISSHWVNYKYAFHVSQAIEMSQINLGFFSAPRSRCDGSMKEFVDSGGDERLVSPV